MRLPPQKECCAHCRHIWNTASNMTSECPRHPCILSLPSLSLRVYTGHSSLSLDKRMTKTMGRCSYMMFIRRNAESYKQSHDRRSCPRTASTEEEKFQHRTGPACTQQEQVGVMTKEQYRGQGPGNDSEKT